MNTLDYLKAVKTRLGIESDYALAKHLGVTRASVSLFQNGHGVFGDNVALAVARILDIDPIIVIAAANAERERDPEMKAKWLELVGDYTPETEKISEGFNVLMWRHFPANSPMGRLAA